MHRGEFLRQQIGAAVLLYGNDVNLVHRLAKNTVPLREYIFATAAALADWPESDRDAFVEAPQSYDVGTVEGACADLAPVKERALKDRFKCDLCGAESPVHVETHRCGGAHCMPMCARATKRRRTARAEGNRPRSIAAALGQRKLDAE